MVLASFWTSPNSMRITTVILNIGSEYNIFRRSLLPLGSYRHVCPQYELPPVGDADENVLQIFSAVILSIRIGNAVNKTIFLAPDYFNVKILIATRFMNCLVNPI